ncbi:MAG: hypothetical protein ACFFD9_07215 [Candidatus Thorarchaeota archaeon]
MTNRFDPPKEGLWPGESIVWTRRAGTGFWIIFVGFIVLMGGPALSLVAFEEFGMAVAGPLVFLTLIGVIIILGSFVRTRRTRYYLTSERIIEARGGQVIREIPLDHFVGKPIGQFLEASVSHRSNNRPVYMIRVYDPTSDEVFELKGLDRSSIRTFEKIGGILECPYCEFDNTAISSRCKNCGAVL